MHPEETETWRQQRAADLHALFLGLPPAGSPQYWRRMQPRAPGAALPLEVLVHCLRERFDAGYLTDAHRLFTIIVGRTQRQVTAWSGLVAAQSAPARRQRVQDDLAQECYTELWRALTTADTSLWAVAFRAKMVSLQSHTAHACMERWGFWTRHGVVRPTRVPADVQESLEMPSDDGSAIPLADQIEDPNAWRAFDRAEYAELVALLRTLDPRKRAVVYGLYWKGMSQQEIAESLGVGTRTVRWRQQRALDDLRKRVQLEGGSA